MKKAIIAGIALATLTSIASAGQPTPVYTTPAPAPCPEPSPYAVEIGAKYGFATSNLFRNYGKHIDTYGGDLTFVCHMNEHHSINLRGGYTFGHNSHGLFDGERKTNLHTFYLMPGYRYTHALNDKWSAYIGGNVGAANLSVKDTLRSEDFEYKDHNSEYGFAYSGEVGLRYSICEKSELFLAYEFFGSTAHPTVSGGRTKNQTYNVVRTGVSFRF